MTTLYRLDEADAAHRAALAAIHARTIDDDGDQPCQGEAWLRDPQRVFYRAVSEGTPSNERTAYLSYLTLPDQSHWLEALEPTPDGYRQRLSAELLSTAFVHPAFTAALSRVQFALSNRDRAALSISAAHGWQPHACFKLYRADCNHRTHADQFAVLTGADLAQASRFLDFSSTTHPANRWLEWQCVLQMLTPESLTPTALSERIVYGWSPDGNLMSGIAVLNPASQPKIMDIAYLHSAPGQLATFAYALRDLGKALGYSRVQYRLPVRADWLVAIEQAGWRSPVQAEVWLMCHTEPR